MAPLQETEAAPPRIFKRLGVEVNVTSHSNTHDPPPSPPRRPKSIRVFGVDMTPGVHSKPNTEKMTCTADHDHQRKRKSASVIDDEEKTSSEKSISSPKRSPSSSPHEASAASSSSSSSSPPPLPPPEFHPRVMQLLEEHHLENLPELLFEKRLEESDVRKNQNRLLITGSERLEAALTEEERRKVGSTSAVLEVITTDPRGVDFKLRLKSWASMGVKVLNHEWYKLVAANGIKKGDTVQGWGFRAGADQQFRLAFKLNPNTSAA